MKLKASIFPIVVLALLMSCTEPLEVTPYTYPTVFTGETAKSWTIRSVQLLQNKKGTQTFGLNTCVLDDVYTFYNNPERTYTVGEGNSKCDAADPSQIVASSWSFVNATASLTIIMPLLSDQPLPFILKEVDSQKMVIDIYFDDDKSNYRINFRAVAGG
jgi:hypothetical protein